MVPAHSAKFIFASMHIFLLYFVIIVINCSIFVVSFFFAGVRSGYDYGGTVWVHGSARPKTKCNTSGDTDHICGSRRGIHSPSLLGECRVV